MSSFYDNKYNPRSKKTEKCFCHDDYFGRHRYGYCFDGEEKYYTEQEMYDAEKEAGLIR